MSLLHLRTMPRPTPPPSTANGGEEPTTKHAPKATIPRTKPSTKSAAKPTTKVGAKLATKPAAGDPVTVASTEHVQLFKLEYSR